MNDYPAVSPPPASAEAPPAAQPSAAGGLPISRRGLLKAAAFAAPCVIGGGAIFQALTTLTAKPVETVDPIVARYDAAAHRWGFVVDAAACIGCGKCVVACKTENGVPLDEEHTRTWIERRTAARDGTVTVESPEAGANGFEDAVLPVAAADVSASQFVPRLCMQCELSPCTVVCPVGATYRADDGIVLVDEARCIGCGYCIVSCPYGARYLVPAGARTPSGTGGVADKCTFCYHRVVRGQRPACVEVCPVEARKFGDLNDPSSEVSVILRDLPTRVLRAELGTKPRVHYVGLEDRLA